MAFCAGVVMLSFYHFYTYPDIERFIKISIMGWIKYIERVEETAKNILPEAYGYR